MFICFTRQSSAAKLPTSELCRAVRTTELLRGACTSLRSARICCFTLCDGCGCTGPGTGRALRELPQAAPMCATASPAQQLWRLRHLHPRVVPAPRCPPALGRAPGLAPNSPAHRLGSVLKEGLRSPVPLQRTGGCAGSGYSLPPWQGVSKTRAAEEAALPLPSQG